MNLLTQNINYTAKPTLDLDDKICGILIQNDTEIPNCFNSFFEHFIHRATNLKEDRLINS